MVTYLNAKQLAFILDIEVQEAREKLVFAYCKSKGESVPKQRNKTDLGNSAESKDVTTYMKYTEYPVAISIEVLADKLNIPTLQQSVNDIEENYLNRPATKKWILCDYPEKRIKSLNESGGRGKLKLPSALASMLPASIQTQISQEWARRYPKWA